jgi:hypothetical protein
MVPIIVDQSFAGDKPPMIFGNLSDIFGLVYSLQFYFHSDEVSDISGENNFQFESLSRYKKVLFSAFEHKEVVGHTEAFKEYIVALFIGNG